MSYYNHYNLDEIAERMSPKEDIYSMRFNEFPIFIYNISKTYIQVIFDGVPHNKNHIIQQIESIYAVGRTKFRHPNELSIFMEFTIYDFCYFHNRILEAIDNAFNPIFNNNKIS